VGLPWVSTIAFLRLVASPRVFERPEPIAAAWQQVEEWLGCERAWIPEPTDRYRDFARFPGLRWENPLAG
jgi:hypothetical protein